MLRGKQELKYLMMIMMTAIAITVYGTYALYQSHYIMPYFPFTKNFQGIHYNLISEMNRLRCISLSNLGKSERKWLRCDQNPARFFCLPN